MRVPPRADARRGPAECAADFGNERFAQRHHIVAAFAQRRELDGEDVQPVVKISRNRPRAIALEVAIGGRDDAGVSLQHPGAAEA